MDNKKNIRLTIAGKTLSKGKHLYDFRLGKDFFDLFQNTEVLDSELTVAVQIEIAAERKLDISVKIEGYVVLLCDRCLERLSMPVSFYGELDEEETEECRNDHTGQLDLTQYAYDNVCLGIPIQRVHGSEKDCDPEMLRIWKDNNIK
ncbi:MAG: hypothetical protein WC128_02860 [Bacteroidales bacterium]|jgi:uncharacterized metal-binding protein YceD (DUF177 family)